jgi:hypothetical protein
MTFYEENELNSNSNSGHFNIKLVINSNVLILKALLKKTTYRRTVPKCNLFSGIPYSLTITDSC